MRNPACSLRPYFYHIIPRFTGFTAKVKHTTTYARLDFPLPIPHYRRTVRDMNQELVESAEGMSWRRVNASDPRGRVYAYLGLGHRDVYGGP